MPQLLVTGLSGFVGSHLAERAEAVDLRLDGQYVDLLETDKVLAAVADIKPEAVIHLAAQSSVAESQRDPQATFRVNFEGTYSLLQALRATGFRGRFLFVGSGDMYGAVAADRLPVTEELPLRPRSPYAVSKVAAEALCYQWSQTADFDVVMARPFNHIGPRQRPVFAVADFARQVVAHRGGRGPGLLQVGDIDATRDFTDVRDVVQAYLDLLALGRNGEAYNVCSGNERSLREMIEGLFAAAGVRMQIEVAQERLRLSEQRRMRGSYAKLRADTGWEPRVALSQTLADTLAFWEAEEGS